MEAVAKPEQYLNTLAYRVEQLRDDAAEAKGLYDDAQKRTKEAERELLDAMEDTGHPSFKRDDGATIASARTIYHKVEDRDALIAAIKEEGMDDELLKVGFEAARLNELVRTRLDAGEELLPGLGFSVTTYPSIRKA